MILAPSRELWVPDSLAEWWAKFTAGKRQRASSGKARRKTNGKILRNSASNTTCCCGGCAACASGTMPDAVDLTFSGVSICSGTYSGGGIAGGTYAIDPSSNFNGTFRLLHKTPQLSFPCQWEYIENPGVLVNGTFHATGVPSEPITWGISLFRGGFGTTWGIVVSFSAAHAIGSLGWLFTSSTTTGISDCSPPFSDVNAFTTVGPNSCGVNYLISGEFEFIRAEDGSVAGTPYYAP